MMIKHLAIAVVLATATTAFAATAPTGWSAATEYELGNSYATSGQTGPAILAYERAQLLAPRDRAIHASLERTRATAGIAGPASSRARAALQALSSDEWTHLAMIAAALACIGVIAFAWSRRGRVTRTLVIAGTLISAAAITAAIAVAPDEAAAVAIRGDTARIAPATSADPVFALPEGETVRVEQARGDFVYVRDGDRAGWVPRAAVERVIVDEPPATHA